MWTMSNENQIALRFANSFAVFAKNFKEIELIC